MTLRRIPVVFAVIILVGSLPSESAAQPVSGSFPLDFSTQNGNTSFQISYTYPSQIQVGADLRINLTLFVTRLGGLYLFLDQYTFILSVSVPTGPILNEQVTGRNRSLYQGSRWGPIPLVVPINSTVVGRLGAGSTANATMSVRFIGYVFPEGAAVGFEDVQTSQGGIGSVLLSNPGAAPGFSVPLSEVGLLAGGLVVALVVVVWRVRSRGLRK